MKIYYYALLCDYGPEVFVGNGSHKPTRSRHIIPGQAWVAWINLTWFYSNITGNQEVVLNGSIIPDKRLQSSRAFRPVGLPHIPIRVSHRPMQTNDGLVRHWPVAIRHHMKPFLACKDLYYEAVAEFFKNRQFVLGSSTYALAWLRRIGRQNAVNLRSVRFKVHREFYIGSAGYTLNGAYWDEVLNRLRRAAPGLMVLGLHYEEGYSRLLGAARFLRRASTFPRLCRVDLVVWNLGDKLVTDFETLASYQTGIPQYEVQKEALDMMHAFVRKTGTLVRVLEIANFKTRAVKALRWSQSGREWYVVSEEIRATGDGQSNHLRVVLNGVHLLKFVQAHNACLPPLPAA